MERVLTKFENSGVAIGSSIFHGVGSLFGGGSSAATEQQQNPVAAQGDQAQAQNSWGARGCEVDARQFTKCLDEHQGNMQICGWYLDQLVSNKYALFTTIQATANRVLILEGMPICSKPILDWR
jgi:hypothetical protein